MLQQLTETERAQELFGEAALPVRFKPRSFFYEEECQDPQKDDQAAHHQEQAHVIVV